MESIEEIAEGKAIIWLLLRQDGLLDETDWIWSPIAVMKEEVPDLVTYFGRKTPKRRLANKTAIYLGIFI